jgi:hypothetical protein
LSRLYNTGELHTQNAQKPKCKTVYPAVLRLHLKYATLLLHFGETVSELAKQRVAGV